MVQSTETTPFTIITGFLGAGKTSLLNHLLSGDHGRRVAVIVNDFGEVNIDGQLLARRSGDGVVELTNGCVCCTVEDDLRRGLRALLDARQNDELEFEHIVMETTGLAKVGPIIQTLSSKTLRENIRVGGVVTVVDALNFRAQLDAFHEVEEQVGMADLLLLNKTDLVDEASLPSLTARLSAINGMAQIKACRRGRADVADVLSLPATRNTVGVVPDLEPPDEHGHSHASLDHVRSFAVQLSEPLDHGRVQDWFSYLIMRHAERLLRYKGLLNIQGMDSRVVLQGVHGQIEITSDRAWRLEEARTTVVVFIGRNLPEQEIREGLRQCIAATSVVATSVRPATYGRV